MLKTSELRKMKDKDLEEKLSDLRKEMSNLNASVGRGTLKKASGSLKPVRRNIARILTIISEKKAEGVSD
ncbi:MAG: 50S ribosomal protein L29 [Nitrososphaerales archaeon]